MREESAKAQRHPRPNQQDVDGREKEYPGECGKEEEEDAGRTEEAPSSFAAGLKKATGGTFKGKKDGSKSSGCGTAVRLGERERGKGKEGRGYYQDRGRRRRRLQGERARVGV